MSATCTATDVMDRAMNDEGFLARFRVDPEEALSEYDLDPEEKEAIESGDESRIRDALGDLQASLVVIVIIISR